MTQIAPNSLALAAWRPQTCWQQRSVTAPRNCRNDGRSRDEACAKESVFAPPRRTDVVPFRSSTQQVPSKVDGSADKPLQAQFLKSYPNCLPWAITIVEALKAPCAPLCLRPLSHGPPPIFVSALTGRPHVDKPALQEVATSTSPRRDCVPVRQLRTCASGSATPCSTRYRTAARFRGPKDPPSARRTVQSI
jgi:hypothetical protein